MQSNINRFRTVRFRFKTDMGPDWERNMLTDNYIPCFRVNQWLELKSIRKASTGQEYAKKMAAFLKWLENQGVSFKDATNRHVRQFLHFLIFGDLKDDKVLSLQSTVSASTLGKYITVITSFYRWLDEVGQTEMLWKRKSVQADKSFLYGQIYSYEHRYLVDGYASLLSQAKTISSGIMRKRKRCSATTSRPCTMKLCYV